MGVNDGLQYFKKRRALLYIGPCELDAEVVERSFMDFSESKKVTRLIIIINEELPIKEKIRSLIHEAIHFGNSHKNYLPIRNLSVLEKYCVEEEIENLTEQVYSCQPKLVQFLKEKLLMLQRT